MTLGDPPRRRILGVYIDASQAQSAAEYRFCIVVAVGDRIMLEGLNAEDDISAMFRHITIGELANMVNAVTGTREVA